MWFYALAMSREEKELVQLDSHQLWSVCLFVGSVEDIRPINVLEQVICDGGKGGGKVDKNADSRPVALYSLDNLCPSVLRVFYVPESSIFVK